MSKKGHLTCKAVPSGGLLEITSPSIGHACLLVMVGQLVKGGQEIAHLYRLNQRFLCKLPDDCSGTVVKIKNAHRMVNLAYDEVLLVIDPLPVADGKGVPTGASDNSSMGDFICSPMDGMFYLFTSPKEPPLVEIGDEISPGQMVGLIEVMKCFYPLKYHGINKAKVTFINVKNATAVSVGTRLYSITMTS